MCVCVGAILAESKYMWGETGGRACLNIGCGGAMARCRWTFNLIKMDFGRRAFLESFKGGEIDLRYENARLNLSGKLQG